MAFQLPPNPKFQQFDTNGNPLTGGKLYTYLAGSSDPVSTYTDSSGATANTNPVILDARGEADVWISDNVTYKFVLTDASDVEIWSVDNISAAAGGSGGGGGNDEFVRVTGADLASQYLSEKMAAGTGISLNVLNAGGVEQLQIVSSADLQDVTDNGSTTTNMVDLTQGQDLGGGINSVLRAANGTQMSVGNGNGTGNFYINNDTNPALVNNGAGFLIEGSTFLAGNASRTIRLDSAIQLSDTDVLISMDSSTIRLGSEASGPQSFVFIDEGNQEVSTTLNDVEVFKQTTTQSNFNTDIFLDPTVDKGAVYTGLKGVAVDTADSNRLVEYDIPSISGQVDSVVAGNGIAVDDTDAANPIVSVNRTQGIVFGADTSLKLGPHYLSMAASGVYSGGTLSVSTPTPDGNVNISALEGFVIDTSNFGIDSIVTTPVSTNAIVHPISAGSLVNNVTYILIDSTGSVVESPSFPTPVQRRDNIFLGVAVHPDNTTVTFVNNLQDVSSDITGQLHDLSRRLGFFNIEGNGISANGANLSINKAAGTAFKTGVNYSNNSKDPDTATLAVKTLSPLRYRTQTGVEDSTSTTVIRPGIYDNAGTETAIPGGGNQATIQRIYVFPSNEIRIQAGQTIYSNVSDAIDAIGKESFVTDDNIKENALLLCQLVVRKNATDLSDSTQAVFFQAGRFGEVGSVGSALTGTLQNAYDNSIDPEIITDSTRSALTLRRGSAADTDNVIEVQNGAGTTNFSVDGNGDVSGTTFNGVALTDGGSATNFLAADGTYKSASTAPSGSDTQVQFNDGGAFGGDAGLTYNKTTDELTVGGSIKSDKFVGIGDTARDNAISKWSTSSIHFPFISEGLAIYGRNNDTQNAGKTINAYNDGTNWRSLSAGECQFTVYDATGQEIHYRFTASASDQVITWSEIFKIDKDGNSEVKGTLDVVSNIKGENFAGIGGTATDNALSKWNGNEVPFQSEGVSFFGSGLNTNSGGIGVNCYYDGSTSQWKSLSAGECQKTTYGLLGDMNQVRYTASAADEVITWNRIYYMTKDGNVEFAGKVQLLSTTNASPTNGDIWYDGTTTNVQGDAYVDGGLTVESSIGEIILKSSTTSTPDNRDISLISAYTSDASGTGGAGIQGQIAAVNYGNGSQTGWSFRTTVDGPDNITDTLLLDGLKAQLNTYLRLNSTSAPASPISGDLWYDGTDVNIQGTVNLRSQSLLGSSYVDIKDSTGWGVRVDGTNDALRPLVDNDTELGLSIRRWSKVWATDADFSGTVNIGDVLNLVPRASDPSTPSDGDIWYNSTSGTFKCRANGVTETIAFV